jgi:hypothetical protein
MTDLHIEIFFYGLFMDADALHAKGLNPVNVRQAQVKGMVLHIGKRATLAESPASTDYGIIMGLAHAEIEKLYPDPSVLMYRLEAVRADERALPALPQCLILCWSLHRNRSCCLSKSRGVRSCS